MSKNNILIVEDHPMMRIAINTAVSNQNDMVIVGEACTVTEGKRKLLELKPDLLLLDLYLPDGNGLRLVEYRNEQVQGTKVLVITSASKEEEILAVLKAGVEGIIGKNAPAERVQYAIREVLVGNNYLMDEGAKALLHEYQKVETRREAQVVSLSARELQVMEYLARGETNAQIAAGLFISESTIRTHLQRIMHKLGLQHKNQLVIYAAKHYR